MPTATKVPTSEAAVSETIIEETPEQSDLGVETFEEAVANEPDAEEAPQNPITGDEAELSPAQEGGNKTIWIIVVILAAAAILAGSF